MSTWNLGANDVSEETRTFRDKLASKDGHIAAQQDRLLKQAKDLEELQERFNETIYKLTSETRRALQLESDLKQRSEDLRNEKIASENIQAALIAESEKNKGKNRDLRDLEATLERISHTSDEHQARSAKLEKEKSILEARIRELEASLRAIPQSNPTAIPGRRGTARPRSSSLSNFRITSLEQDIGDLRSQMTKKDAEIEQISQKLSRAQQERNRADNERIAAERKWHAELDALHASLEEKDEELSFLRGQDDGNREEELLARIEEDEAKIAALELMVRGSEESKQLKEKVQRAEAQLMDEQRRRAETEECYVEVVRDKEEVLNALNEARREKDTLAERLQATVVREREFNERAGRSLHRCEGPLVGDTSCLIDLDSLELQDADHHSIGGASTDTEAISHIERLLVAVDRLRGERDSLRRDLQFLEFESKFTIEALEQKLACSTSVSTDTPRTMGSLGQIKQEMDELHAQLLHTTEAHATTLIAKNHEIRRLSLYSQGLATVFNHTRTTAEPSLAAESELQANQAALLEARYTLKELEEKYDVTILCLEAMTSQRDDLLGQLKDNDGESEKELRREIEDMKLGIDELNTHIDNVESERDSLALQLTNLTSDLENAQDELRNAESRYTSLQFHQLSTMTSNEATRTLREHIGELEARVMRRTEQIGIHQHDIRRLETNLRLQEERLTEMMTELEMMAAQKDAMVEDCADAREARDEALVRVEALEDELEASSENERLVTDLIGVVVDTASRARNAIRFAKEEATRVSQAQEDYLSSLRRQLDDKETSLKTLTQLSGQYRDELETATEALARHQSEVDAASAREESLQKEMQDLNTQLALVRQQDHDSIIQDLLQQKEGLERDLKARESRDGADDDTAKQLVELKLQHADATAALQERLVESQGALEEAKIRLKSADDVYRAALEDSNLSIKALEAECETAKQQLQELQELSGQSKAFEQEQLKKIADLEEELAKMCHEHQEALRSCDAAEARLSEDLHRLQKQQEDVLASSRDEQLAARQELEKKVQTMQGRFEENVRLLDMSKEEAARLAHCLQDVTEGRTRDQEKHAGLLSSAKEQSEYLEQRLSVSDQQISTLQDQLRRYENQLRDAEDQKTVLQQDITMLEAEVQKSKALQRYLETQVKDGEHLISSLRGDLERTRGELAHSEKACKAAEVNLSLQNAQQKRETTELHRELATLRSRPNLDAALSELEERNNEMEELLRTKCAEIEANDDRVLEMLKEKKKLTTKVESLNRKVQNLQAKLSAAKASNVAQPPSAEHSQPSSSNIERIPQAVTFPLSRPRAVTAVSALTTSVVQHPMATPPTSVTRKPVPRVVSGPSSSLPRPKTPERTKVPMPVFKPRTPERPSPPVADPIPASVIGKKRSAPDDFEACENIPVQAFSAEGKDAENRTPRVRRVLSSLQSGFTPNRNQIRPTIPMPSPKRPEQPLFNGYISDMTNSPFILPPMPTSSAKPGKRSWLGKIRGTSSQTVERPSGARTFFGGIEP